MKKSFELPIDRMEVMHGVEADRLGDRIRFRIPAAPGHYGLLAPELAEWLPDARELELPCLVRVALKVDAGRVGAAFSASELTNGFVTAEACADTGPQEQQLEVFLDDLSNGARLMIRNYGCAEAAPAGELLGIEYTPARSVPPAELKRARAREFPHWYYTTDLGDGVVMPATLPDEPGVMRSMSSNRAILGWLLRQNFGDLTDRKVVDIACSAGYHDFALARAGAAVVAFDWDPAAIRQAKFIQECIGAGFRHRIDFRTGDLYSFAHPEAPFDLVYCSGLFYHLRDPLGGAQRMLELCREGAVVQSCVATRDDCAFELCDSNKYAFCSDWESALVPSAAMFQRVFEHVGFREVRLFHSDALQPDGDGFVHDPAGHVPGAGAPAYLVCLK